MSYTVFFDSNKPNGEHVLVTSIQAGSRQHAVLYSSFADLQRALSHCLPFVPDAKVCYGGKQFDWDAYYGRTA